MAHLSTNDRMSLVRSLRQAGVTLPRLRCLEDGAPDDATPSRPVWRGPPRSVDPASLPIGSRVVALSVAMRAAVHARALPPAAPRIPEPAPASPAAPRPVAPAETQTVASLRMPSALRSRRLIMAKVAVMAASDLDEAALMSSATNAPSVAPRLALYWLLTDVAGYSTAAAGQMVRRDHSTVMHGRNRVRAAIAAKGVAYDDATPLADLAARVVDAMRDVSAVRVLSRGSTAGAIKAAPAVECEPELVEAMA